MKIFISLVFVLISVAAQAQLRNERGNCHLMMAGESDRLGRACLPGYFGITYNGYFVENQCYPSIRIAQEKLSVASYCDQQDRVGEFAILYPQQRDVNQQYCDQAYAVTYRGYVAERRCWMHVGDALNAMYEMATPPVGNPEPHPIP